MNSEADGSWEINISTDHDSENTIVGSSPVNNIEIDGMEVTLGNNTSGNDEFEDAIQNEGESSPELDITVIDKNDEKQIQSLPSGLLG